MTEFGWVCMSMSVCVYAYSVHDDDDDLTPDHYRLTAAYVSHHRLHFTLYCCLHVHVC